MQPLSPCAAACSACHAAAPHAIKMMVRSSRGDGARVFSVVAPARGTIADVKQLMCRPPHSTCSDASALALVLKGKAAAAARALQQLAIRFIMCIQITHAQAAS